MPNPNKWPVQHTKEFMEFLGERGTNLKTIDLPFEMKLAWQLRIKVRRTICHHKGGRQFDDCITKGK